MTKLSDVIKIAPTMLLGFILSLGLVVGVIGGVQGEPTQTLAREIVASQKAYVSTSDKSVTFIAISTSPILLTLHIDELTNYTAPMGTSDNLSHLIRITNLAPGTYHYYFSFGKDGHMVKTSPQIFQIL